jgi:hypothetical protein
MTQVARITTNRRRPDFSLIFAVRTLQLLSRQVCEKSRSDLRGMKFVTTRAHETNAFADLLVIAVRGAHL